MQPYITQLLRQQAADRANQLAIRYLEQGKVTDDAPSWTYAELYAKSLSVAAQLRSEGLAGKTVVLLFPPGLDFVAAFHGALLARAIAVPVPMPNPRSRQPLRQLMLTTKAARSSAILTTQANVEMARTFSDQLPAQLRWIAIESHVTGIHDDFGNPDGEDLAYLQFTSGSTGDPKGVMISHDNILANMAVQAEVSLTDERVKAVVWAPHYHDLCLVGHILGPIFHGFESTIMSPMDFLYQPVRWLQAISHFGLTHSASPNFGYQLAASRIRPEQCRELNIDLSSWIVAGNGGEPVQATTLDMFSRAFAPFGFRPSAFLPTLGMAESVLFVSATKDPARAPTVLTVRADALEDNRIEFVDGPTDDRTYDLVSCGATASDHRMMVVDPESFEVCEPGRVGELWLQGPSVAQGYYGRPEETMATFGATLPDVEGTFLRTGDLGFLHEGAVYLTGRFKDLIIIGGKNHYPNDIERTAALATPAIRPGSCAAFSHIHEGQELVVLVAEMRPKPVVKATEKGVQGALFEGVANTLRGAIAKGHGVPLHSIVLVEPKSLRKTSSGKVMRRHYKGQFAKGQLKVLHQAMFAES